MTIFFELFIALVFLNQEELLDHFQELGPLQWCFAAVFLQIDNLYEFLTQAEIVFETFQKCILCSFNVFKLMVPLLEDSGEALFSAPQYVNEEVLSFLVEWSTEQLSRLLVIGNEAILEVLRVLQFEDGRRVSRDRVYEQIKLLRLDVHKVREFLQALTIIGVVLLH